MPHTLIVKCPICTQAVAWQPESRYRPFCSEKCQLIDLGKWADDQHVMLDDCDSEQW